MKEYSIKTGMFDRTRMLLLKEDSIEWESGNVKGSEFTKLRRSEITDFKHGVEWMVWYKFDVGKQFSLSIKGSNSQELKIRFNSLLGTNRDYLQMYSHIVDDIWRLYYSDVVNGHLDRLEQNGVVNVAGVTVRRDEIEIFDKKSLLWHDVAMKEYGSYFALFDRNNSMHYRAFRYNEYGSEALWSLVRRRCKDEKKD